MMAICRFSLSFFFNDPATTEIYTLSLHDALPISTTDHVALLLAELVLLEERLRVREELLPERSEEHTSELQSQSNLVCRLLLEKKKKKKKKENKHLNKESRSARIGTDHTIHTLVT